MRCDEALKNAKRLMNPRLIQLGCMMQWNSILPLLQSGIRAQIRKPLQFVADCLEEIESMEWLLRCQMHFELAKCDEEIEQLQTAEQHLLKAIHLDDENVYEEQLSHSLKRLRLRAELYKTPELVEDQAAMILEQCVIGGGGKSNSEKVLKPAISDLLASLNNTNAKGADTINIHSLLLRVADILAPNEFTHVLESETYKSAFGKANDNQISRLHKKALNYENCVTKCAEHLSERITDMERELRRNDTTIKNEDLERMIRFDYKQRLKLWFDLSRIARKQQIWDICRVSSRFCLIYDNEKFINRFLKQSKTSSNHELTHNQSSSSIKLNESQINFANLKSNQLEFACLFDKELMRNIAETHFIFGEAIVQFVRQENVELFEKPPLPDLNDKLNNNNRAIVKFSSDTGNDESNQIEKPQISAENQQEWQEYCDWLLKLSKEAIDHFLRGIIIGVQLNESWVVTQGGAYIWNYLHHLFEKKKYTQAVPILTELLDALKKVGHNK
jgi:hypothetical protein